jgi:4'-phosphopantetheinyl transferase
MHELLSADERRRARSFHFEKDRSRYVVARGYLRVILSRYLNAEPNSLRLRNNSYGKPTLVGSGHEERLHFNLSHSGSLALYAITQRRRVGIDVERIRDDLSHEEVAKRFFSPTERAMLHSLPVESRTKAFFDCWTRKEAYVKGRGEGLTLPLEQFSVSIDPTQPIGLIENRVHPADVSLWSLEGIDPGPGYAAAIAVEGHDWSIACFDMPDNREPGNGASPADFLPSFRQRVTGNTGSHGRGGAVVERAGVSGGVRETESRRGA